MVIELDLCMTDVIDFFRQLFDSADWPPRWHCGKWTQFHGWVYIISDLLIWSSYFTIPLLIIRYLSKRRDTQFVKIYVLFAAFILACGATHFLDAIAFWLPVYRLSALVRFFTALISWLTVFQLIKLLPQVFTLKSSADLQSIIDQRTAELQKTVKEFSDYKYALDQAAIVAITDKTGIIKHVNENFCKISKYQAHELIGKDHRIINSSYHSKEFIRQIWQTIMRGEIWKGELKNKAKDGTPYWVDTTIIPFLDELGKPYQYLAIRSDITERKKFEEQLVLNELIINSSEDAIISKSLDGIITSWNRGAENLFGFKAEEMIGKDVFAIIPPDRLEEEPEIIRRIERGEYVKHYETKRIKKDGTILYISLTVSPIRDFTGKIIGASKISRDITEKKEASEKILKLNQEIIRSEKRFRGMVENANDIIRLLNDKYECVYSSANVERITGWNEVEMKDALQYVHPDDRDSVEQMIRSTIGEPGKSFTTSHRFKHKKGHYLWMEGSFTNLLHDNAIEGIVCNLRDVSQRKQAEDKLAKSEKIYKAIASNIPGSIICLLDRDLRYTLIEGDMLEMVGYSKENLLGNLLQDVGLANLNTEMVSEFKKVFEGKAITRETHTLGYDFVTKFVPLKDENDAVNTCMMVSIDVTELKKAQHNITELNQNLEQKVKERTGQLEFANNELEAFSYSVSHDLRAPLRAINGYSKMLEEDYAKVIDVNGNRLLQVIQENTKRMGLLIDDLLSFSRLGKKEPFKTLIDMNALARLVMEELAVSMPHHAKIEIGTLHPATADGALLKQVFINFISNAIKYSSKKEHPKIEINSVIEDSQIVYSVRDNGSGFDMQYVDKLFGVFQRLHTLEEFEGNGVGLAFVKRIITKHGGRVWAEGIENQGATFYFSLPNKN